MIFPASMHSIAEGRCDVSRCFSSSSSTVSQSDGLLRTISASFEQASSSSLNCFIIPSATVRSGKKAISPSSNFPTRIMTRPEGLFEYVKCCSSRSKSCDLELARRTINSLSLDLTCSSSLNFLARFVTSRSGLILPTNCPHSISPIFTVSKPVGLRACSSTSHSFSKSSVFVACLRDIVSLSLVAHRSSTW